MYLSGLRTFGLGPTPEGFWLKVRQGHASTSVFQGKGVIHSPFLGTSTTYRGLPERNNSGRYLLSREPLQVPERSVNQPCLGCLGLFAVSCHRGGGDGEFWRCDRAGAESELSRVEWLCSLPSP